MFYYHKEVLRELQKAFSTYGYSYIDGGVLPTKRSKIVDTFIRGRAQRLFFGQMEACGEGIDGLQQATSTCVFIEPSWSHTDIEQCIGRLERSGQRNDINVHILTIKDTLEARMMEVVAEKLKVDEKLYDQKPTKERTMAKKNEVSEGIKMEDIQRELGQALATVIRLVVKEAIKENLIQVSGPAIDFEKVEKKTAKVTKPEPVVVEPEEEEDVTEEAIRTRVGDIAALLPDGTGKTKCIEVIKKIGGGKLADLNTPALRVSCMKELDTLYSRSAGKK